jgi:hypothetical protein
VKLLERKLAPNEMKQVSVVAVRKGGLPRRAWIFSSFEIMKQAGIK